MIYQIILLIMSCYQSAAVADETVSTVANYQEQLVQQPYHFELYQELAILASHQKDWGAAKAFAEMAVRLDPWSQRSQQVWQFLREQNTIEENLTIWNQVYESGLLFVPWWLVLSVTAVFLLIIVLRAGQIAFRLHFIRRYRIDLPRPWRAFLVALFSGFFVFILAANKLYFEAQSFARVRTEVALTSQPQKEAPELAKISIGQKVKIIKTDNSWYFVKASSNKLGWVNKEQLILLPTLQEIYR